MEEKRPRGAPKGNRNAAKPDGPEMTARVNLHIPPDLKARVEVEAGVAGLNAWIRGAIEMRLTPPSSASPPPPVPVPTSAADR